MEVERKDLVLAKMIDDGYISLDFDTDDKGKQILVDTCLICKPNKIFKTPNRALISNDWSENNSLASKELAEHLMTEHSEYLTLASMKIGADA